MNTTTGHPPPIRVLFVANDPIGRAVTRYRCENFAEILRASGSVVDVVYVGSSNVTVEHDVVVLHRICAVAEGRAYARAARACGAALVYGADDLVFDAQSLASGLGGGETPARQRLRKFAPLHAAMLREADAALLSTEFLADRARVIGGGTKPVFVLRNFISGTLLDISAAARDASRAAVEPSGKRAVTLGYLSGTPSHDADLAVIAGSLAEALTKFDDAELLLVGPVAEPDSLAAAVSAGRVRRNAFVPWRELPGVLAGVDVNLAPLDLDDPLTHGKSEIKLLEAAALRIPTVASASAGYREAFAADPRGGTLAQSASEWPDHLGRLIGDPAARQRAGDAAWEYVNEHGTAAANAARVRDTFAAIHCLARPRPARTRATRIAGSALSPIRVKYWVKSALRRARNA